MGVRTVAVAEPFSATSDRLERVEPLRGGIDGNAEEAKVFLIRNQANDDFLVLNALRDAAVAVGLFDRRFPDVNNSPLAGGYRFPADANARGVLSRVLPTVSTRVRAWPSAPAGGPDGKELPSLPLNPKRIGLYQPWAPSMDEGWTRFVLEKYGFKYTTLHNADIRAGALHGRIDTLVIPSIEPKTLREGYAENETEPAYVGGLGSEGADALREFARDGGTLVFLADSTDYAIEVLGLPVKNVLKGLKSSEFYSPGSILHAVNPRKSGLTEGVPHDVSVYFDRSQAFEVEDLAKRTNQATILLAYGNKDPLESGWLLGPEKIEGKAALVEVRSAGGRILLFGFRPQHRGQTHGTFRLLFNALL
jgi:hypothetical protein